MGATLTIHSGSGEPCKLEIGNTATIGRVPGNDVFRLESLAKDLGQSLLVSADFARHLPAPPLTDFGKRVLKGKSQPVQVYGCSGAGDARKTIEGFLP